MEKRDTSNDFWAGCAIIAVLSWITQHQLTTGFHLTIGYWPIFWLSFVFVFLIALGIAMGRTNQK